LHTRFGVKSHQLLTSRKLVEALGTRFTFFTGKGGVGKTSLACAAAVTLADAGKRVLLVSTDPASNLDETFGVPLSRAPKPIPGVPGLSALNIDPDEAAEAYRTRVIEPLLGRASQAEIDSLREQLSGACTTEIAAFDEFATLLADDAAARAFDHILFDTAPTGHTLRLLSLPKAWTHFFDINERGASCLGPHTALKNQQARFEEAFSNLSDPVQTLVMLVARPDWGSMREAERTSEELVGLGLTKQVLVVNAVFRASGTDDALASKMDAVAASNIDAMPAGLAKLDTYVVPLRPFNTVGLEFLRRLVAEDDRRNVPDARVPPEPPEATWSLRALVDELSSQEHALVLVMGKGGVGKTTVAAAIAAALAERGVKVHLSTTDPAAHVAGTVADAFPNLKVSRIDPRAETAAYTEKILANKGKGLDAAGREMLLEDLASPCTEEVAVFHAFTRIVMESRRGIVILDTAPTGHTLLLLDAAGSYHREMLRKTKGFATAGKTITPLMQLKDPSQSKVILVALPETTPVSEAAALQDDLRRAGVEPAGWVINRCLSAAGVSDPLLVERARLETAEIARVTGGLSRKVAILPWTVEEPVGVERLVALVDG
jgi:arsenite-transporting ATPase